MHCRLNWPEKCVLVLSRLNQPHDGALPTFQPNTSHRIAMNGAAGSRLLLADASGQHVTGRDLRGATVLFEPRRKSACPAPIDPFFAVLAKLCDPTGNRTHKNARPR